jgi:hypothetical protein
MTKNVLWFVAQQLEKKTWELEMPNVELLPANQFNLLEFVHMALGLLHLQAQHQNLIRLIMEIPPKAVEQTKLLYNWQEFQEIGVELTAKQQIVQLMSQKEWQQLLVVLSMIQTKTKNVL